MNENTTESTVELNEDGEPRPERDPRNGLYTVITLVIFAVVYSLWKLISANLFVSYIQTETNIPEEMVSSIVSECRTPLPEDAYISMVRLSHGTDNDRLRIRYSDIGDRDEFTESFDFGFGDPTTDERTAVYMGDDLSEDYVFADIYINSDDPDMSILIYDFNGKTHAEFIMTSYNKSISGVFKDTPKLKIT